MPDGELRQLLVCPACHRGLAWATEQARCDSCGATYAVVQGIPILLPAGTVAGTEDGEHKAQQAAYFDEEDPEFEITRPHGTSRLYRWLLAEKFRRSVAGLGGVSGRNALTVCGGSGMDADYLARAGARVIASDISLGAALRTAERGRRFGLGIYPIVADAERLPFADGTVDLVYVHDGLHHLERPYLGLAEMARVGQAVSVTEPARAFVTAVAVRLGLALEVEEAGNRVERLAPNDVAADLERRGLRVVRTDRYAMYYRHKPGRIFAALSKSVVFPLTCVGWRVANSVLGRGGNKFTVQAMRSASGTEGKG